MATPVLSSHVPPNCLCVAMLMSLFIGMTTSQLFWVRRDQWHGDSQVAKHVWGGYGRVSRATRDGMMFGGRAVYLTAQENYLFLGALDHGKHVYESWVFEFLMHERTPHTELQWVRSVPDHIPDQAVIFEKRSHGEVMFVARVIGESTKVPGSFVSGKSCAEYLQYDPRQAKCLPTFDFLVLKHVMTLTSVSYDAPDCLFDNQIPYNTEQMTNLTDESNTTCVNIPRGSAAYTNLIWTFSSPPSSVNLFRVVLFGPEPCNSNTTFWFVRGENNTWTPSECVINQEHNGNYKVCDLACQCAEPQVCGYLHFQGQFPPWVTSKLLLCHIELMTPFPDFVNPDLVIYP